MFLLPEIEPGDSDPRIPEFVERVAAEGRRLYREFPWRATRDPYAILVSEVMLQQTQVARVVPFYETWLADFPTLEALAAAPLEVVLRSWQGLGYNRRAIALKRVAETVVDGTPLGKEAALPCDRGQLLALPGVGPATASGVRAFAFGQPDPYLETNVRAVFLHELFADRDGVPDSEIAPLVAQASAIAGAGGIEPRAWNYALLDYGAYLKRAVPNPSRRSAHHGRQSTFEGSRRQKRARLLRSVMATPGASAEDHSVDLGLEPGEALGILEDLAAEGFVARDDEGWRVP